MSKLDNKEVLVRAYKINDLVHKHIEVGTLIDEFEHRVTRFEYINGEPFVKEVDSLLTKIRNGYVDKMRELLGGNYEY